MIGKKDTIERLKKEIKIHFRTKEEGAMSEYMEHIIRKKDKKFYMYQAGLIMKLKRQFKKKP